MPSDIRFISESPNNSFMLRPINHTGGDIVAMNKACVDYAKFDELTRNGVTYVTKMKKSLVYKMLDDRMYMNVDGQMAYREQRVVFSKHVCKGGDIPH